MGLHLYQSPKRTNRQENHQQGGLGEEEVSRQMRWEGVGGPMSRYRPTPSANAPTTHHQPPRNNTHTHTQTHNTLLLSSTRPTSRVSFASPNQVYPPPPIRMPRGATPDLHCPPFPRWRPPTNASPPSAPRSPDVAKPFRRAA